ncbi:unnamed protein product [Aphanomyces euteiches]|nr:hypothetical protein Ae201684P_014554 [Aphanomyces euteiches]
MQFRAVAAALLALIAVGAASNPHEIKSLPGYDDVKPINFNQFAGQVPLPSNGQKMFYWLVQAETSPSTAPLVLWLNGGPGCSSLSGFFTELGPFVVQSDLTVKRNPYAWNRRANMVFLESPAGVGFSQPVLNASDYKDDVTASRAREFLVEFLQMYPEYKGREFYITGESYAGMYIPFLVDQLLAKPVDGLALTGFAVGNPYTDQKIDDSSYMDYYYSHGLISIESYRSIQQTCSPDELWLCQDGYAGCSPACSKVYAETLASMDAAKLNPYYILGDICLLQGNETKALKYHKIRPLTHRGLTGPCVDTFTQLYLSQAKVQEAIHAPEMEWVDCSDIVTELYTSSLTVLDKYVDILKADLKVLVYSGDADSIVNFIGTQRWMTSGLNLTVREKWEAWFGPDKQLAGYTETYTNLTFKTIKGAGHMVPTTRPLHGLFMFECFVFSNRVCNEFGYPKDPTEYLSGADLTAPTEDDMTEPIDYVWWWLGLAVAVAIGVAVCVVVLKKPQAKKTQYVELTAGAAKPTYT